MSENLSEYFFFIFIFLFSTSVFAYSLDAALESVTSSQYNSKMMFTRKSNRASIVFRRIFIVVVQRIVELIKNFQSSNDKLISNSRIVTIIEFFQSREISINDDVISNRENLWVLNTTVVLTTLTILTIFEEFQSLSTKTRNDATSNLKR